MAELGLGELQQTAQQMSDSFSITFPGLFKVDSKHMGHIH